MIAVGSVAVLAVVFIVARSGTGGGGGGASPAFQVGRPGPGQAAPPIVLPSTAGGTFDLAAQRGKTVLLYFQEGIGCQPCWDQIRDIEKIMAQFKALGIDEIVSIAGNPLDQLRQKVTDEHLSTAVLGDPDLSLGSSYQANHYGMMGTGAYGHTFIVVAADGTIRYRADFGGSPNYTMYVAPSALLADLRAGLAPA
jgi:peroxiredoxin